MQEFNHSWATDRDPPQKNLFEIGKTNMDAQFANCKVNEMNSFLARMVDKFCVEGKVIKIHVNAQANFYLLSLTRVVIIYFQKKYMMI